MKALKIAGASGFWGDSAMSVPQVLAEHPDFIIFDYLAEITMSILARARQRDPNTGFAIDFVNVIRDNLHAISKTKTRIVCNAGGVNPVACAEALRKIIAEAGLSMSVGVVLGDDLQDRAEEFSANGIVEMFDGREFPTNTVSINAYLGAYPIAAALSAGADIVVTGRCVDSAMVLGACIAEFKWPQNDWDRLAAASLAGHILECGAQASGGIATDWQLSFDWDKIGYPIVNITENGDFHVFKPANSGGMVDAGTVAEQILYEIGDPQSYYLPDVTCDFSNVKIRETASNVVFVNGAKGRNPSSNYKVSATYNDGHRVGIYMTIIGPMAALKAERTADAVLKRMSGILDQQGLPHFTETSREIIGAEAQYGPNSRAQHVREVVLKLAAKHEYPVALKMLVRELTSAGTSMAPGTTGMGGNRPKIAPVVRLFSFLIDKKRVPISVRCGGENIHHVAETNTTESEIPSSHYLQLPDHPGSEMVCVPLVALARTRSGDKGDMANIGVIARDPRVLPWIWLGTGEAELRQIYGHLVKGQIHRYYLPGLTAINILMDEALGGGGMASLRNDPQGKSFGQMLLETPIAIPVGLARDLSLSHAVCPPQR